MYYGGYTIGSVILYGIGIYELLKLELMTAFICLIIPAILSIYFRVIAMRRCRDIGWPAFLPWLTMLLAMGCGFFSGMSLGTNPVAAVQTLGSTMVVAMALGMLDFVFLIVIGCLGSADRYGDTFGGRYFDGGDLPDDPRGYVDSAAIIAPAPRARPIPQGYDADPAPIGAPQPAGPARAVAGFGRRVV